LTRRFKLSNQHSIFEDLVCDFVHSAVHFSFPVSTLVNTDHQGHIWKCEKGAYMY